VRSELSAVSSGASMFNVQRGSTQPLGLSSGRKLTALSVPKGSTLNLEL